MKERKAFISVLRFFPRHQRKKRSSQKQKKKKTRNLAGKDTKRGKSARPLKHKIWTKNTQKILTITIQTHVFITRRIKTKEEGEERRSARTRFERKKKQKKKKNNTDDGNNTNGGFDATLVPFGV